MWDKTKASKNGPSFSHIFFANDILLFAKANAKNCTAILEIMNNFCSLARQKVNHGKSRVFFSPNVIARRKRNLCQRLGIIATNNLGKYLGFPIIHQGRVGSAFNFIMEKVQSKLIGWKTKLLSRAGRIVLSKQLLLPLQNTTCSAILFPTKFVM